MNNHFKYNSTTEAPVYDEPTISIAYDCTNSFNMEQNNDRLLNVIGDLEVETEDISGLTDLIKITEGEFNSLKG